MARLRRLLQRLSQQDLLKFPEELRNFRGTWVLKTFAEINFRDKFVKFIQGSYEGKIAKLLYKTSKRLTVQFYTNAELQPEKVSVDPRNCVFLLDYDAEESRQRAETYQLSLPTQEIHPSYAYLAGQLNTERFCGYYYSSQCEKLMRQLGKDLTSQDINRLKTVVQELRGRRKISKRKFLTIMTSIYDITAFCGHLEYS